MEDLRVEFKENPSDEERDAIEIMSAIMHNLATYTQQFAEEGIVNPVTVASTYILDMISEEIEDGTEIGMFFANLSPYLKSIAKNCNGDCEHCSKKHEDYVGGIC